MRKGLLPVIAMGFAATLMPARPSHSQELAQPARKPSYDELLQRVERLEERVKTLEGLDEKVKVLDRRVIPYRQGGRSRRKGLPSGGIFLLWEGMR